LVLLGDLESKRPTLDRFVVREQDRVRFIKVQDVDAIEAAGVYVVLHRGADVFVLRDALSTLESRLARAGFVRVHRSWLVNTERVAEVRGRGPADLLLTSGLTVPVSRRHRGSVLATSRRDGRPPSLS